MSGIRIKKKYKLNVEWDPRIEDVTVEFPLGVQTKADGALILDRINRDLVMELKSRGYNINTMKFSIEIDFNNPKANERFPTLMAKFREELSDLQAKAAGAGLTS